VENRNWNRREVIKAIGVLTVSSKFASDAIAAGKDSKKTLKPKPVAGNRKVKRKIRCIVLGAGNRGKAYSWYSHKAPEELDIVGVAEPVQFRRDYFCGQFGVEEKYRFSTWEDALAVPKFADAVIISTPDHLHYGPAMRALELGYDLLLEKPIAQSWRECKAILRQAKKKKRIVGVCHVLRYTPYFRKIKEVVDSGMLGELMSIDHAEVLSPAHMVTSYVRGPYGRKEESNPILLAKSCHDLDIIRWLVGERCRKVSSFGSLKIFKEENAPAGSTDRCSDGCAVEASCPYSALRIHYRKKEWLERFHLHNFRDATILKALKEGPYGRCVYRCGNNNPDHQIVAMDFGDQITANFTLAMSHDANRKTRIMGSMGNVVGDGETLWISDFRTEKTERWNVKENFVIESGHGGGDFGLMSDFVQAVAHQDEGMLTSNLEASMESHLIGFQAEKAREKSKVVRISASELG